MKGGSLPPLASVHRRNNPPTPSHQLRPVSSSFRQSAQRISTVLPSTTTVFTKSLGQLFRCCESFIRYIMRVTPGRTNPLPQRLQTSMIEVLLQAVFQASAAIRSSVWHRTKAFRPCTASGPEPRHGARNVAGFPPSVNEGGRTFPRNACTEGTLLAASSPLSPKISSPARLAVNRVGRQTRSDLAPPGSRLQTAGSDR